MQLGLSKIDRAIAEKKSKIIESKKERMLAIHITNTLSIDSHQPVIF